MIWQIIAIIGLACLAGAAIDHVEKHDDDDD